MKIEKVLLYRNYALFLRVAKSFAKNLKQNITLFSFRNYLYCTFRGKYETNDKSCFSARSGKIDLRPYDI